ncbi:MAG: BMC domain-containing protein [Ruminococcaceae bacterium]|nr:BMC domain-containing protein [Oscillospiraceae bacterium]
MNALGMLEVYSFTTAVCAADIAAKAADVRVIAFDRTRPGSADVPAPLVMEMKIEGDNASVKAAIEAASAYAKDENMYIVSHVIPRPGEDMEKMAYLLDINKDKYNKKLPKSFYGMDVELPKTDFSIGLIEISGLVAAITGLDAMVKAADVKLIHSEKRLGGRLVTLIVKGSVSAVTAAVEAGVKAASPLGQVHGKAVIANPHGEIMKFFDFED